MSSEAIAETHQAAGVIPAAPWRLRAVSALPEWRLAVTFNDGLTGIVDLADLVNAADAGVFEPLRDAIFLRVSAWIAEPQPGQTEPIWRRMPCTRPSAEMASGTLRNERII